MILRFPGLNSDDIKNIYASGYNLTNYVNNLEKTFETMKIIGKYRLKCICDTYGRIPEFYFEIGVILI